MSANTQIASSHNWNNSFFLIYFRKLFVLGQFLSYIVNLISFYLHYSLSSLFLLCCNPSSSQEPLPSDPYLFIVYLWSTKFNLDSIHEWVGSYLLECGQHFSGYTTEEASKHLPRQPLIDNGCLGRGMASWALLHPWKMLMDPILCRQPQLQRAHECNCYAMFRRHLFVCFCHTFLYPLFF